MIAIWIALFCILLVVSDIYYIWGIAKNHKILVISMSNTNIWTSNNYQAVHCEDPCVLRQLFLSYLFFG